MLMGLTVSVSAGNDGLIGANIKDGELLGYYGNGGDIKIPDTVTVIAGEAFLNNDNVTSVTIRAVFRLSAITHLRAAQSLNE